MDLALPASLAPPGRGELGTTTFGDTGEVRPSDPNLQQVQSYLARFGQSKLPVQPASPAEATAALKRSFDDMLEEKMRQVFEHRERQTQAARSGSDFIGHDFGMARIKRLMREDSCDDPLMIGMNAPHVAAYGCELFIAALTQRAWAFTQRDRRQTIQRRDLISALESDPMYDFLQHLTSQAVLLENSKGARGGQSAETSQLRPVPE